ncbi:MAG: hypothetical protein OEV66_02485 [Spirochaetia bacterium]|nr:hypothetical protein [Spirochaetia bacterium]
MTHDIASLYNYNRDLSSRWPDKILQLKTLVREEIAERLMLSKDLPLIVNGHQAIFYHPGLVSKEILAFRAASQLKGNALSVILDHDPNDLIFSYPAIKMEKSEFRIQKKFKLLASKDSFHYFNLQLDLNGFFEILENIAANLKPHYREESLHFLEENFAILKRHAGKNSSDLVVHSRMESLKQSGMNLLALKTSEITALQSWKQYCASINSDIAGFASAYNLALHDYRNAHGIKNHAQPVPDLKYDELPFWVIDDNGKRQKASYADKGKTLLPRAITLSIFLRLFASDVFVHGTGGARYDQVTNSIIQRFFRVTPLAFLVKTASLQIPVLEASPVSRYKNILPYSKWQSQYRDFQYHPEKIRAHDPFLVKERFRLVEEFRNAVGNKKQIHERLEQNRLKNMKNMNLIKKNLHAELDEIKKYSRDKSVLFDRSFPYFFYDINELINDNSFDVVFPDVAP